MVAKTGDMTRYIAIKKESKVLYMQFGKLLIKVAQIQYL